MKHTRHIISALVFLPLLVSCAKVSSGQPDRPELPEAASGDIDASCSVIQIDGGSGSGKGVATRTIIGQTTIASIDANFIKLDESLNRDWKSEDYAYTEFRKNGWNSERTMVAARAELMAKSSGFLPPSEVESPFPAEQTMDSLHNSVSIFEMVVLLSEDWDASSLAESG